MVCSFVIELFTVVYIFFFKQKTAYEMRISDWSSDVCSSDLLDRQRPAIVVERLRNETRNNNALLRLALAESQLPDADSQAAAKQHIEMLGERFAATRTRGEATHRREEARYLLELDRKSTRLNSSH